MFEITGNPCVQTAIREAHKVRGEAVQTVWNWLFGNSVSR